MKNFFKIGIVLYLFNLSTNTQGQVFNQKEILLQTKSYNLDFSFDFEEEKLFSTCKLTVYNPSEKDITEVPLLLYRLLKVTSIKNENGEKIPFTQNIYSFEDWEVYQVNLVIAKLEKPIIRGESKTITIKYEGYLLGYTETGMSYVQDKISPEFTILRPDCNAYPTLGYPSFEVIDTLPLEEFDYTIRVTVPDSLVVANGGKLISSKKTGDMAIYIYENIKPAWRIDIAVANYKILEENNFKLFYFPQDEKGAKDVLKETQKTYQLYSSLWGELKGFEGFAVLEIPDGWGSQADVTSILQTSAAFKNGKLHTELYHEISHLWNVKSLDKYPPRWNEGLAMFLQFLTSDQLKGTTLLKDKTEQYLNRIKKSTKYDKVPMVDYGKEQLTGYSYTTGMLMFHVLYLLLGPDDFHQIISSYYNLYEKSGSTSKDFFSLLEKNKKFNVTKFSKEWFYTTEYVKLVKKGHSIDDIVRLYQ